MKELFSFASLTCDYSSNSIIVGTRAGQTSWHHCVGEGEAGAQLDQGKVIVIGGAVVVGVRGPTGGSNIHLTITCISSIMVSNYHSEIMSFTINSLI